MTLCRLSRHMNLCKRLERDTEILAEMNARAYPGAQKMTGMPHPAGISDKTGSLGTAIADMKSSIKDLRQEIEVEREALQAYIQSVDDERVRMVLRLRFVCCLEWRNVAYMMGPAYDAENVRKIVYRHLKK